LKGKGTGKEKEKGNGKGTGEKKEKDNQTTYFVSLPSIIIVYVSNLLRFYGSTNGPLYHKD
jgi:hypothetical protein